MSFDNIHLEKGMYAGGRTLTQTLESLDPSAAYKGTALENLDAFQRQLKRFDIKVSGPQSDVLAKFFAGSDSSALFPEYVSRAVQLGLSEADQLQNLLAATTYIQSQDYRALSSDLGADEFAEVGEGEEIPQTVVSAQKNLTRLKKRGRMLVASYETLKFQRLDVLTVTLKQIGAYIARQQLSDAVDTLINGDGNDNAAQVVHTAAAGMLGYADLLALFAGIDPFEMNAMLVSGGTLLKMLAIDEFKNPETGLNFQATGKLTTPLGAALVRTAGAPDGAVVGLDKNYALEMIVANGVQIDYDRLIDRQLERAAISCVAGFAKIFTGASMMLKL